MKNNLQKPTKPTGSTVIITGPMQYQCTCCGHLQTTNLICENCGNQEFIPATV